MSRQISQPSYSLHRATGQAKVRIDGKDHYLGVHDSPQSHLRYQKLMANWRLDQQAQEADPFTITLDSLCLHYLRFVDGHYVKNGKPTSEPGVIRIALRYVLDGFGPQPAAKFGPKALKLVRDRMVSDGLVRTSVNRMIGRIKRMFRWGVAEELVSPETLGALEAVSGLQRGRGSVKESAPVLPVDSALVDAVKPFVGRQVWAMIQLQLLTACRPGEVLSMRGCDLTMEGDVWEYRPESHKTQHHGRDRVIYLNAAAQAVVRQFFKRSPTAYLFSPADAKREFQEARRVKRKTPLTPSQLARQAQPDPARKPGDRYTVCSYGQAIRKACLKAGIDCWHPNQLRHTAATTIRKRFGLESAQVILGHARADVTQVYAERDQAKARQIVAQLG